MQAIRSQFGPCQVRDPIQPKNLSHSPFGFVVFDNEIDAQTCLSTRRIVIDGETVIFSTSTNKPRNESQGGSAYKSNQNNIGSSAFSFGGIGSNPSSNASNSAKRSRDNADLVTNKSEPKRFKAILSHCNGVDEIYVQDLSGVRAVEYLRLQEELSVYCQTAAVVSKPQTGEMYAGLYSEDEAWYRCIVLKRNPDGTFLVQFVDYGNDSNVKTAELRKLTQPMLAKPTAAVKCHLKDLIAKSDCKDQVKHILTGWQEILLECEAYADFSIDLYNKETDTRLRTVLINSGCVMLDQSSDASSDAGSVESQTKKGKKNKQNNSGGGGGGDSATNGESKMAENLEAVLELRKENNVIKKQLAVASKKINQLSERKNIDSLNKDLHEKLANVRTLRPKFPVGTDGIWNQAITLLSEAAYTKDTHEEIFNPVLGLYDEYTKQQDQLRQCSELDEMLVAERDKTKTLFCEAVKACQQRCAELKASDRKMKLNEVLVKLSELYPSLSTSKFEGDIDQTISNFLEWQASKGEDIKNVQKTTEEALDALSQQLRLLQQGLELEATVAYEPVEHKLEAATQLAISALKDELEAADMSEGKATYKVIYSLCSALQTKIGDEFALLDEMHNQLDNLQETSCTIEPWLGVTEPENLDWMQKREKKLKELRSQLRHRMADLDDLKENDDEELSETEISDMEKQVDNVRNMIHSVIVELEEYIQKLADISYQVFPEFAIQFPKLQLRAIKEGDGFVKALRDVTFYKDNGNTQTTFNGKPVILKTLSKPAGSPNAVPDVVRKIHNSVLLKNHVDVDAVFFSKNGVNTYVQLSSGHETLTAYMRDMTSLDVTALEEFASNIEVEVDVSSISSDSPASEEDTEYDDDSADVTSANVTNIGV